MITILRISENLSYVEIKSKPKKNLDHIAKTLVLSLKRQKIEHPIMCGHWSWDEQAKIMSR